MQTVVTLRLPCSLAPVLRGEGRGEGLAALVGLLLCCLASFAQDKSLDQQLLDDLKPLPAKAKPVEKKPGSPKTDLDDALKRELDQGEDFGAEKKEEHPLVRLAREMKQVQERIDARDTASGTQQKQKAISDQLAKLIEQTQKKPSGGQSGDKNQQGSGSAQAGTESGNASSRPGQQSTQRLEQADATETQMNDIKDALRRIWGHLPEKEREEMIGALGEQFLPKYERLIEAFYKRLAERPSGTP